MFGSINRYGDILIIHFPERMLIIYEQAVNSIAKTMIIRNYIKIYLKT